MEFEDKKMVYDGCFVAGMMTGKGKMQFANGMHYDGEWQDDNMCGEGVLSLSDGRVVKGTWMESVLIAGELQVEAGR
jgi:hypothetical protein